MSQSLPRRVRVGVVLSALWACVVYTALAGEYARLSGPKFVAFGVVPLLLAWGLGWILAGGVVADNLQPTQGTSPPLEASTPQTARASATSRACARWFDIMLCSSIVGYPLGYALAEILPKLMPPWPGRALLWTSLFAMIFLILSLPLSLLLDALLYRLFGNTPGKALLSLSVRTRTDSALTAEQYLNRNFAMWGPGFAFGLPGVQFITLFMSESTLRKTGSTRWDWTWGYTVVGARRSALRLALFGTLGFSMLVLSKLDAQSFSAALRQVAISEASRPAGASATGTSPVDGPSKAQISASRTFASAWVNPLSGMPSNLASRWHEYPALESEDYRWVFRSESGEFAAVDGSSIGLSFTGDDARTDDYLPITQFTKINEGGRAVWEGNATGLVLKGKRDFGYFRGLSNFLNAPDEKFARAWFFEGSGSNWRVLYLAPAASPAAERNAQEFFESILASTRGDEPFIYAPTGRSNFPIDWRNPVSGETVQLSGRWDVNPFLPNKANPWAYTAACLSPGDGCAFTREAVGVRFIPDADAASPVPYADALRSVNDPIYRMLGTAQEMLEDGRPVLAGQGRGYVLLYPGQPEVRYWLFRANGGVWRVIYAAESGHLNENTGYQFFKEVLSTTSGS
ncbi:RDD family protein [Caballeronia calidae]|uniref:RDD family protein n=1 Tax=Caballeronia calidae TaxID=1777139 RepID=A0A158B8W4_9BURK|nr:RDD family protein [Caballeronia calidae]SAK66535.1 RDD family protein [Caballeronia calidae]